MSVFDLTHFLDLFLAFIVCKGEKKKKTKSIYMLSIFVYHIVSHSIDPTNVL